MTRAGEANRGLSWFGIFRLGLVMFSLGAVVVLTTSVFNRVISIEYGLPAMIPGILVGWREALQFLRPRWGYGSDRGGQRTPWILGGMATLALGGALGALAIVVMDPTAGALLPAPFGGPATGIALALVAYTLIGIGVGAAGTCLLALLATTVAPARRPASAALVWILMIVGFAVTAGAASTFLSAPETGDVPAVLHAAEACLDPDAGHVACAPPSAEADATVPNGSRFSPLRLLAVCSVVCALSFCLSVLALFRLERNNPPLTTATGKSAPKAADSGSFWQALKVVWAEPRTRQFGLFILIAMLAFELQSLIMEPFGALAFNLQLADTTRLASYQHGGVAVGMILIGVLGSAARGTPLASFRLWSILGCLMSASAHVCLVLAGSMAPDWSLPLSLVFLGFSNGVFAVAAIGSMMMFASDDGHGSEGTRMGIWGTAQAVALGAGAVLGTLIADAGYWLLGDRVLAFQSVFALEAALFVVAACLAFRLGRFGASPALVSSSAAEGSPS